MRTPAGSECKFFYGNYHRGKNIEECRLVEDTPSSKRWTSALCKTCPVPGILRANACEHMTLSGVVSPGFLHLKRHMQIRAFCHKSDHLVEKPHIGCELCHPLSFKIKIQE